MKFWDDMKIHDMEQLIFCQDDKSGLRAVIAIHSTKQGPALGGCRFWSYASEADAVRDAMKLAKGMTYKAAISGLPYGGGKAVVWNIPGITDRDAAFEALGRFIDRLHGEYITGVDLGTTTHDMDQIHLHTKYVTDQSGTLGAMGDFTAEMTAYGVFLGIKESMRYKYGSLDLHNTRIVVQGLGKVGYALCRLLHQAGASLFVTDIDTVKTAIAAKEFDATPVSPETIYTQSCDVFAPCALGGVLNHISIPLLTCGIVAGAANNQLADERLADMLEQRNILYAPDFAINAGGIISTGAELSGADAARAQLAVEQIPHTLAAIYSYAKISGITAVAAATKLAEIKFM
ncbi:Glu/Leu/Phe/Val dehydrogenase [Paenibacillus sp. Marseille-Q4541]|uniref:Leu/Phe/Val dehydrogenase n=1 Tax=Paenibacillus sp. Marseille-Q4541 TaxID=2831522 RepID=UPI001BADDC30|nr:Glu/Leu/Phe/Val dehydrogenase [Paenibacillus sp. Marseille-Q4541]